MDLRNLWLLAALMLGACASSAPDSKPEIDFDRNADFADYRSFAWNSDEPLVSEGPVEESTQQELMTETALQLEKKGLKETPNGEGAADLIVSIHVGLRPGGVADNYESWGAGWETGTSEVRAITTAEVSIEMVERQTGQQVWAGSSSAPLSEETYQDRAAVVKAMVDAIIEEYPPGR